MAPTVSVESPHSHLSKITMHETNGYDGLAENAGDDLPLEQLPNPTPPENIDNPEEVSVYAAKQSKPATVQQIIAMSFLIR